MFKDNEVNFYKIVQTIENGKCLLSAVPGMWETNGKLIWPPKSKKEKALRRPWDPPGTIVEGWTKHDCVLKRSYIPSYTQALNEIRVMSDMSDTTDIEQSPSTSLTTRKRTAGARKTVPLLQNADIQRSNFNDYQEHPQPMDMEDYEHDSPNFQIESTSAYYIPEQEPQQLSEENYSIQQNNEEEHLQKIFVVNGQLQSEPSLEAMIGSLVATVAKLQTRLEHCISLEEDILLKFNSRMQAANEEIRHEAPFEPINSIQELVDFEAQLNKKDFVENLFCKLCSVCGPKSGHYGDNVSYRIVDSLFSRKLFTLVSWSGVSRTKTNANFSRFVNTFKFFFDLVKNCDANYTESDLKGFFQKIINNSKRRFEIAVNDTPKRISSSKYHNKLLRTRNNKNYEDKTLSQIMDNFADGEEGKEEDEKGEKEGEESLNVDC